MTIQMIEDGILNNDMGKVVKGFNSITGKKLVEPEGTKESFNINIDELEKNILDIKKKIENMIGMLPLKDKDCESSNEEDVEEAEKPEEEDDEEEDENEEGAEEEELEEVDVEDDEEEVDEFAIDEDGNKYRVMAEESEEKEIFGRNRIKTKFVTNEPTEEELAQNKKIKVKKKKNNPVKTRDCIDCGEKTTNTYTRKGKTLSVCVKCENKRIGGGDK